MSRKSSRKDMTMHPRKIHFAIWMEMTGVMVIVPMTRRETDTGRVEIRDDEFFLIHIV